METRVVNIINQFLSNKDNYDLNYWKRFTDTFQINNLEFDSLRSVLINCNCTIELLEMMLSNINDTTMYSRLLDVMLVFHNKTIAQNEWFIEKHCLPNISPYKISDNLLDYVTEQFILNHKDNFVFIFSGNRQFSENFIETLAETNDVCWQNAIRTQCLSENIIRKYLHKLGNLSYLCKYKQNVSENFLLEFYPIDNKHIYDWVNIVRVQTISEKLIKKLHYELFLPFKQSNDFNAERFFNDFWHNISYRTDLHLNENFWSEFADYIDWYCLASYQIDVSEQWLNEHWQQVKKYKSNLILHRQLSIEFIEKHIKQWNKNDWANICYYQKLPISFIEKYKDMINYNHLYYSPNATKEIKERYFDRRHETNIGLRYID